MVEKYKVVDSKYFLSATAYSFWNNTTATKEPELHITV
jgi:hypothetical protein